MKKILLILFICLAGYSCLFARDSSRNYFRLERMPVVGYITLDTGWTFHAGDDKEWAKPEFDDSRWQGINPIKRISELPQLQQAQIGWLRLRLRVGNKFRGKTMALMIFQTGASEIYLNGKFIYGYGKVSADFKKEQTYNPMNQPLFVQLSEAPEQVLAVRYSFNRQNFYPKNFSFAFFCSILSGGYAWSYFYAQMTNVLFSLSYSVYFFSWLYFIRPCTYIIQFVK